MTGFSAERAAPRLAGLDRTFQAFAATRQGEPAWLRKLRADAFDRFAAEGLPTRQEEEWKYTSLRGLSDGAWDLDAQSPCVADDVPGVRITPLHSALATRADLLDSLLAPRIGAAPALDALNTAFVHAGLLIEVADGAQLAKPIDISQAVGAGGKARFSRIIIRVGRGASAHVVERRLREADVRSLLSTVTEIDVAEGGRLVHANLQSDGAASYHLHATRVAVGRDGRLGSFVFAAGGAVTRNDLVVALLGEGAAATLDGLYVVNGKCHVDNHTSVDHRVPRTTSRQLYKGLLAGEGRAVFNGKVYVRAGARLTDAYQMNRNLLLSSAAEIDTKPELRIDADDVKCSHGASIGPLNPDEIFYLQSRAIPREAALRMLSVGFADDVLLRLPAPDDARRLRQVLMGRLAI